MEAQTYKPNLAVRRRESLSRIESRERQRISNLSAILTVMVKAVQKAGRAMIRDFGELSQLQVREKGAGDFVSDADLRIEKILFETLSQDRPEYGFISEEMGAVPAKNDCPFTWIMDPIDGTTNFIHAVPFFAISLALRHYNEITAAVLFNPITNELYYAEKGEGFFLMTPNGNKRLRVSGRKDLYSALIGLSAKQDKPIAKLTDKVASFRHFGSTTLELAMVGAGQLDAMILEQPPLWDIATAYLFIKEAGGMLAACDGKTGLDDLVKSPYVIATNLTLFDKLKKGLKEGE